MAEQSDEQSSPLQEYQKRLEELMESAREGIGRQTPEVLDKLAATANNIARRLEDMASDARQRGAEKEATPGPRPIRRRGPSPLRNPIPTSLGATARPCPSAPDPVLLP
jgi:hypothetical protein